MEFETMLMVCQNCNSVYQYYDYLSHIQTCSSIDINNNSEMDTENDMENDMENDNINNSYMYSSYNGLNNYGHYNNISGSTTNLNTNNINLYNSTVNRGFNTDISVDNLSSHLQSINFKTGLDKVELFKYSKKEECNQSTDCPICLCSYPKKTLFYIMNCSHSFCINCCEEWFSQNYICPLCRTNYSKTINKL